MEILLIVVGIVVIVIGLAVSIALHEIGHLVPAKKFGVKVGQYMIGFGPTLWSRRFGETEYGLKAIPLGGYISMAGMFPPARPGGTARTASTGFFDTVVQDARDASASTIAVGDETRVFYRLSIWKRIIIMLGGPFMNLVIAIVLYGVLLCGFGIQQASTTIQSVSACVLPAGSTATACSGSDPIAPGVTAGIKPGDRIVSMNGTAIGSWAQATKVIRSSPGTAISIVVDRTGQQVTLNATPLLDERYAYAADGALLKNSAGTPITERVGFLGVSSLLTVQQQPVGAVLPAVGDNIAKVAGIIVTLPQRLIQTVNAAFGTEARDPNGPISVVGVGRIAGEIASTQSIPIAQRAGALVGIVASLNVALLVFNLIPLMPLDGGHVAGALWEGIRRFFAKLFKRPDPGPVDTAKLVPLTLTVVVILGVMSALLIYADIVKPITLQ